MKTISEIACESGHKANRIKFAIMKLKLKEDRRVGNCLLFGGEKEQQIVNYANTDHRKRSAYETKETDIESIV